MTPVPAGYVTSAMPMPARNVITRVPVPARNVTTGVPIPAGNVPATTVSIAVAVAIALVLAVKLELGDLGCQGKEAKYRKEGCGLSDDGRSGSSAGQAGLNLIKTFFSSVIYECS
jgi:hypothetical protein